MMYNEPGRYDFFKLTPTPTPRPARQNYMCKIETHTCDSGDRRAWTNEYSSRQIGISTGRCNCIEGKNKRIQH